QRLREDAPDLDLRRHTKLVLPQRNAAMTKAVDDALMTLPCGSGEAFDYSMIRAHLPVCLIYVGWDAILVRPYLPPTTGNELFRQSRQRVYLSATLGDGGELERAFGRAPIARLPLPTSAGAPRSGRRFFVFPSLVDDSDSMALASRLVAMVGKALV